MKTLQIESDGRAQLDLACVAAGRFVLWRRGGDVQLTLDDLHVTAVRRVLALRGVRATSSDESVPEPPRLVAAIGIGLAPARLHAPDEIDLLDVRVVPVDEATVRLTRRLWLLPLSGRRRSRCRALLRGTDAPLELRRSAWCGRATPGASRRSLRPVLFDRTATPRALRIYAADGVPTRWIDG